MHVFVSFYKLILIHCSVEVLSLNCALAHHYKSWTIATNTKSNSFRNISSTYKVYMHNDNFINFAGHDIVASFVVNKSVGVLEDNILQLTDEIFDEIEAPSTKVPLSP